MMKEEKRMLLCDEDEAYASALAGYLLSQLPLLHLKMVTEVSRFLTGDDSSVTDVSEYDLMLLSDPFLEVFEAMPKEGAIPKVVQLCDSMSVPSGEYDRLYKFQSMDLFLGSLKTMLSLKENGNVGKQDNQIGKEGCEFIALYAPSPLELQLPVALFLGRIYAKRKPTLLIDMQENSILPELLQKESEYSLVDYLYLAECRRKGEAGGNLKDYLSWYDDLAYLPPVRNPSEISFITGEQWEILLSDLRESDFETVLLLFDRMHQGFSEMAASSKRIYLLMNQGGLSRRSEKKVERYLESYGLLPVTKKIVLPQSMTSFPEGDYPLEELSDGRLMSFVRNCVEEA